MASAICFLSCVVFWSWKFLEFFMCDCLPTALFDALFLELGVFLFISALFFGWQFIMRGEGGWILKV